MDAVLQQAPVSGLAVACVETVLEHGCLDIVAFMLLFRWEAFNLFPEHVGCNILVFEVPPPGLVVPGNAPSLASALLGNSLHGFIGISRSNLPDRESVFVMRNQFPAASALHFTSLELHIIVGLGKLSVLRTLVGTVGIEAFDGRVCNSLAVRDGIL